MGGAVGSAAETRGGENRRGRPTAARVAEIDEAIYRGALTIFLEAGYGAASMDVITAEAQVSKGTLYARYTSKEALFRTVLEREREVLSARAGAQDHLLPDELGPRLRQHARVLVASMRSAEFQRMHKLIVSAELSFPEVARLWHEIGTARYVRFLAQDMAKCSRLPEHANVDWTFLANLFLHAVGGWQQTERLMRAVNDQEVIDFADAVIATILSSISNSK